jgi:hypothetical protein
VNGGPGATEGAASAAASQVAAASVTRVSRRCSPGEGEGPRNGRRPNGYGVEMGVEWA